MRSRLSLNLDELDKNWSLIRFLMDDPPYRERYLALLRKTADGVFAIDQVEARMQADHDIIAPYTEGADGERAGFTFVGSEQAFESGLQALFDHVASRRFLGGTVLRREMMIYCRYSRQLREAAARHLPSLSSQLARNRGSGRVAPPMTPSRSSM